LSPVRQIIPKRVSNNSFAILALYRIPASISSALSLKNDKHYSRAARTIAHCGIKLQYGLLLFFIAAITHPSYPYTFALPSYGALTCVYPGQGG
jgi:hypothetical protein